MVIGPGPGPGPASAPAPATATATADLKTQPRLKIHLASRPILAHTTHQTSNRSQCATPPYQPASPPKSNNSAARWQAASRVLSLAVCFTWIRKSACSLFARYVFIFFCDVQSRIAEKPCPSTAANRICPGMQFIRYGQNSASLLSLLLR